MEGPGLLTDRDITSVLSSNRLWQRTCFPSLRAAAVHVRNGEFESRSDILYKKSNFVAQDCTPDMPVNIVDVVKSYRLWMQREPFLVSLFGRDSYQHARAMIDDVGQTIANEYFVHEGGHCLGYDIDRKSVDGYFSPGGKPAAWLIALEELRADLHGFELAEELLPPEKAVSIFVYNIMLRFGVHVEGQYKNGVAPYGLVPYLLFDILRTVGVNFGVNGSCSLPSIQAILGWMRICSDYVKTAISTPEALASSSLEAAMNSAAYVRERLLHPARPEEFQLWIEGGLSRIGDVMREYQA
jgi:hypothetical protein